jgi:hypothetical protein
MAMGMRTASWSRSAASSWGLPVPCAAATRLSAQAPAAFAPNAAPVRDVAEDDARHRKLERHAFRVAGARVFNEQLLHLIGHVGADGYSASPLFAGSTE